MLSNNMSFKQILENSNILYTVIAVAHVQVSFDV